MVFVNRKMLYLLSKKCEIYNLSFNSSDKAVEVAKSSKYEDDVKDAVDVVRDFKGNNEALNVIYDNFLLKCIESINRFYFFTLFIKIL